MSSFANHTCRVAFVYHNKCIVFFCQIANLVHRSNVAVHRENTIGNNNAETLSLCFLQTFLQFFHVSISVTVTFSLAEANTVYNRGMVQCVRDDSVFFVEQCAEYTAVSIETSCVEDSIFCFEVIGNGSFKFLMNVLCSADKTYRRHTEATLVHHFLRAFYKAWVVRQAEIVVSAEVQYLLSLH